MHHEHAGSGDDLDRVCQSPQTCSLVGHLEPVKHVWTHSGESMSMEQTNVQTDVQTDVQTELDV